jgi:hypothetical protein
MEDEMIDVAVDEGNYERLLEVEIINGLKCENTKTQYRLKFEHFKRWVELKRPLCISADGNVLLHLLDKTILKEFLGHKCKKKDKNGLSLDPFVFHAFLHVSGYKSAMKDYYSNILKMSKQFFEGYVRTIAKLKQDGVMSIIVGKQPMYFKGYKFLAVKAIDQGKDTIWQFFSI